MSLELQLRAQTENRRFFELRKQLQSGHLSTFTYNKIHHKTLIRPVLLYGSETWVLTKREENQFLVFKRKLLRTICGPKQENGTRGDITLNSRGSSTARAHIINIVKTKRLCYAGLMIRTL
jgi:hypothetical protein